MLGSSRPTGVSSKVSPPHASARGLGYWRVARTQSGLSDKLRAWRLGNKSSWQAEAKCHHSMFCCFADATWYQHMAMRANVRAQQCILVQQCTAVSTNQSQTSYANHSEGTDHHTSPFGLLPLTLQEAHAAEQSADSDVFGAWAPVDQVPQLRPQVAARRVARLAARRSRDDLGVSGRLGFKATQSHRKEGVQKKMATFDPICINRPVHIKRGLLFPGFIAESDHYWRGTTPINNRRVD